VEHDPLEGDFATRRLRQPSRLGRRDDFRRRLEKFGQAFRCPGGPLQIAKHFAQRAGRTGDHHGVEDKRGKLAAGDVAGEEIMTADPQHRGDSAENQGDDQGGQHGARLDPLDRGREGPFRMVREALPIDALMTEGLDRANAG